MRVGRGSLITALLATAPIAMIAMIATVALLAPARALATDVDRVELSGITVFPGAEIEAAVEVAPGDKLERAKVVRTAENVQALYRSHGYEQATIRTQLVRKKTDEGTLENVLEFVVTEGRPTRVASIRFVSQSQAAAGAPEAGDPRWARIEARLLGVIGLAPGDILDQEKLATGRRVVQDMLAAEEFVGAKVTDLQVADAPAPVAPIGERESARWVALTARVDLGDRVTFGFRGNVVLTEGRLMALVDEQRVLGFGKDYVGEIRARVEEEYRNTGYARVQVTPYTFERAASETGTRRGGARAERHVTYQITEGPRVRIESIEFDGNSAFASEELRKELDARSTPAVWKGYYVQKDVQRAADALVEWMKSRGYLASKLVTINSNYVTQLKASRRETAVRLTIYLYEGEQTVVQSIGFVGTRAIPSETLAKRLGIESGSALNLFAFGAGLESIKAAYREQGYLDARIVNEGTDQVVVYTRENRFADIHLEISEGAQYRLSRVQIDGLTLTRDQVVLREVQIQPGEVLEQSKVTDTEARIRRLGVFSVVTVRLIDDPEHADRKIMRISVQEGTPGIVAGGVGYRNDLGPRLFGQAAYTNLGGRNQSILFNAAINRRQEEYRFTEYQAQLSYIWPWFVVDQLTFRPSLNVAGTQYINFDAENVSIISAFERPIFRRPNLTGVFTYSLEHIRQFNVQGNTIVKDFDEGSLLIGSVAPALRLDMRDNALAPTSGLYASTSYEFASPYFGSQRDPYPIGFTRFQFRSDYYVPISKEITWFLSFRTGYERQVLPQVTDAQGNNINRSGIIPRIKQFSLGGVGSIRGFKEQELNLKDAAVRGTASYVNYRSQLDLPFAGPLRFALFLDAANLLVDRYSLTELRYGTGFGFHYQTPVGPVNLDWGFKIKPRPGEDPYKFYFSIGVI